jgi:D-arabinose 1-dehydrogenase-like Zn-dependent alcohol dehydrogenase
MSSMKAARVIEFNAPYKIESIPIPKPDADQLLVKTGAAGFCHTGMLNIFHCLPWTQT